MNATDILVMPVASYFVNMYFLGCLRRGRAKDNNICRRESSDGTGKIVGLWDIMKKRFAETKHRHTFLYGSSRS